MVKAFAFAVTRERIYLRAFVVMPDHWHALLGLRQPWTLPKLMHSFMSHISAETNTHLTKNKTGWQDGYYETLIKTARQFTYVAIYIEENPVKKGCVASREHGNTAAPTEEISLPSHGLGYSMADAATRRGAKAPPTLALPTPSALNAHIEIGSMTGRAMLRALL